MREISSESRPISENSAMVACGVINAGQADGFSVAENGGEVVWALVVEQREVVDGAGGEDAGDFAFDEFSGFGLGGLLGDGDAFVRLEQAGDVALRGVVGDAAHGRAAALGEGHVENGSGGFRILEKHLVEVPEAVKQDDVRRQRFPHGQVLGHHRGRGGSGHVGRLEMPRRRIKSPAEDRDGVAFFRRHESHRRLQAAVVRYGSPERATPKTWRSSVGW